jgi:L-threonylcarbamoyladenylate synthase
LTIIVPRAACIPAVATAGLDSVAVRAPSHPVSRALLEAFDRPIAAPSANKFGRPSPTTAQHVLDDLGESIDVVLDAGPTPLGVESTVIDVRSTPPVILRPGGITMEQLALVLPEIGLANAEPTGGAQASPGRMARHYAPETPLYLLRGSDVDVRAAIEEVCRALGNARLGNARLGLMLSDEDARALSANCGGAEILALGPRSDATGVARSLYAAMRELDRSGVDLIITRDFGSQGLALAVLDRLSRAADDNVVEISEGGGAAAARRIVEEIT